MSDCIAWHLKGRTKGGYGMAQFGTYPNKVQMGAHRYVWQEANGDVPEGLVVRHKCDNKKCWNIHHLELGTQAQNVQDGYDRGIHKPNRKLDDTQFKDILARCHSENNAALAREFGVSRGTVCNIKKGRVTYGA